MVWYRWSWRLFGPRQRERNRAVARRSLLRCEALETRCLLSTYTVTDPGDVGAGADLAGDLRYCLSQANANAEPSNQILFAPDLAGTISLTQGVLLISKDVSVVGPGAGLLTISGSHESGVFEITADATVQQVALSDLTIANGTGIPTSTGQAGGGLYNDHADVTLTRVTVTGNSVTGHGTLQGGGIYHGAGTLILDSSTVAGNTVGNGGKGGGIYDFAGGMQLDASTIANNQVGTDGSGGGIDTSGVQGGLPITLTNCILTGNSVSGALLGAGGGIENVGHPLTLRACLLSGNQAGEIAGGFLNVAATATLMETQISGNTAPRGGGGLWNDNGRVTLIDCSIAGNASSPSNGFGGGINNNSQCTLTGCTISGNSAYDGGGIYQSAGVLALTNCTVSENTAGQGGGGIYANQGALGIVQLTSVTITANSANGASGFDQGGGGLWLYPPGVVTPNRAYLDNTLIAGNTSAGVGTDVSGTVLSVGFNLIGQADDSQGWGATDRTGSALHPLDPRLGPLQDNGGPTLTHALLAGSPAFEVGDMALRETLDQRGTERLGSHPPDIGACQAERIFTLRMAAPAEVAAGDVFSITVTALDFNGHTASTFVGAVHFSSSDGTGLLPADYTFTPEDGGVHTFVISLETPGLQTLQVTDTGNAFHTTTASIAVDASGGPAQAWPPVVCSTPLVPVGGIRTRSPRGEGPPHFAGHRSGASPAPGRGPELSFGLD